MVRAAAKNHANVAVVTSPARYDEVLAALDTDAGLDDRAGAPSRSRRSRTRPPTTPGSPRSCRGRMVAAGLLDAPDDPYPPTL